MNIEAYFVWMCHKVCTPEEISKYHDLLLFLNSINFTFIHPMDENRKKDGESLRYHYAWENGIDYDEVEELNHIPCSVLEMMIALSMKCENILSSIEFDDRTGLWFWDMIRSLGLDYMTNDMFDEDEAGSIIFKFLNLEYDRTGQGGLFTISNMREDLRDLEIWQQMHLYMKKYI